MLGCAGPARDLGRWLGGAGSFASEVGLQDATPSRPLPHGVGGGGGKLRTQEGM